MCQKELNARVEKEKQIFSQKLKEIEGRNYVLQKSLETEEEKFNSIQTQFREKLEQTEKIMQSLSIENKKLKLTLQKHDEKENQSKEYI